MKKIAIAAGALLAMLAGAASAQMYYGRPYVDPYAPRVEYGSVQECWNPGAGHFEAVRPGEYQDDLDFSRCRPEGSRSIRPYPGYSYYGGWR